MENGYRRKTIKFRQHASTLDGERNGAWVELYVDLVELPLRCSKEI